MLLTMIKIKIRYKIQYYDNIFFDKSRIAKNLAEIQTSGVQELIKKLFYETIFYIRFNFEPIRLPQIPERIKTFPPKRKVFPAFSEKAQKTQDCKFL